MKLFLSFLRDRLPALLAFALSAAVLTVSFALYRLPLAALLYPAVLILLIGAVILAADFFITKRKYRELDRIKRMTAETLGALPPVSRVFDKPFAELTDNLKSETLALEQRDAQKYADMLDYYSVWVHQIKTPIASMRLTLQNDDSALARAVLSELLRIEQYVEMALAYLRLESDSTDYVFRTHDLDVLVKRALRRFSHEFIGRRLTLRYEPCAARFVTDEKWFSFVLEQLLSNALKYTRRGGVTVSMPSPTVLCIADSGIGIAAEDLPRVFERGYTGGNGRLDRNASGLGLFLCKRVCENLGADIRVESTVGEGTRVYLDITQKCIRHE